MFTLNHVLLLVIFHSSTRRSQSLKMAPSPLTFPPTTQKVYTSSSEIWEGFWVLWLIECDMSDAMCLPKWGHKMPCSFLLDAGNTPPLAVSPPNTAVMLGEVQSTWRRHGYFLQSLVQLDTAFKSPQPRNQNEGASRWCRPQIWDTRSLQNPPDWGPRRLQRERGHLFALSEFCPQNLWSLYNGYCFTALDLEQSVT